MGWGLGNIFSLGAGLFDMWQNNLAEQRQQARVDEGMGYIDQFGSQMQTFDPFAGMNPMQAMPDYMLGPQYQLGRTNEIMNQLGFDPNGGYQQIMNAGNSQLFDPSRIDSLISDYSGELGQQTADIRRQQQELGAYGSTNALLGLGDPMERRRAVETAGAEAAGQNQQAALNQFNESLARGGSFDPFDTGLQQSFAMQSGNQLYSDLNAARTAGQQAQFGTEDTNAGLRQQNLATEAVLRGNLNTNLTNLWGEGGLAGNIASLENKRGEFVQQGLADEQQRLLDAISMFGTSLTNSSAMAGNEFTRQLGAFDSLAQAGLGAGQLNLQGMMGELSSRLGVLAPENQLEIIDTFQNIFNTAGAPGNSIQAGGYQPYNAWQLPAV
jgi:hypothetical protein